MLVYILTFRVPVAYKAHAMLDSSLLDSTCCLLIHGLI